MMSDQNPYPGDIRHGQIPAEANHLLCFQFYCILLHEYPEFSSLAIILLVHFALYNQV